MAGPTEGKDNRAGVGVESGDVAKAQKRRLQLRPREATWGPGTGPGISDRREGEGQLHSEAQVLDPRRAWPGRGSRGHGSPVLFEKLVRLPEAVVEQHVDAGQGQLRVLQGRRRRRRRRVSVIPPPRPLLLRAGHGRARLCAGPRRGRGQLLRPGARPEPAATCPERRGAGGGAGRGGEGGAATGCGAGDVRAEAAARRRRGGLLSSRPPLLPLPPRHAARAGTEANPFPGVSNPAEPGPERPPPPLPAAPAPGPCGCPHRAPRPAVQGQRGYARGHEPRTLTLSSKRAGPGASGKPERASGLKRARGTPPGKQQERAAREQVAAASARRFRHESLKPHAASTRDPQLHPDPGAAH